MKRCLVCNRAEVCFTKAYFNEGKLSHAQNEIWLCQNQTCVMAIHAEPNQTIRLPWDRASFVYKSHHLTELNETAIEEFDKKVAIIEPYV